MPASTDPVLSVITVNYETSDMVARLAASLARQGLAHEFIVVDNPSPAGDVRNLGDLPNARVVQNPDNVGYGQGLNSGAVYARGRYIGVLNPDTEVPPGELAHWVDILERENAAGKRIGVLGPRLVNDNGTVQRSAYQFVNPFNYWLYHSIAAGVLKTLRKRVSLGAAKDADAVRKVGWVMGAAMLVPREVFDRVGGFSKSYFMYAEDTDLCWRIAEAGWNVCYAPEVAFTHSQGEPSPERRGRSLIMLFTSIHTFLSEHFGPSRRIGVSACVVIDMALRVAVFGLLSVLRPSHTLTRSRLRGALTILRMFLGLPDRQ